MTAGDFEPNLYHWNEWDIITLTENICFSVEMSYVDILDTTS